MRRLNEISHADAVAEVDVGNAKPTVAAITVLASVPPPMATAVPIPVIA